MRKQSFWPTTRAIQQPKCLWKTNVMRPKCSTNMANTTAMYSMSYKKYRLYSE